MPASKKPSRFSKSIKGLLWLLFIVLVASELSLRLIEYAWPPIYHLTFDDTGKQYIYMLGGSTSKGIHYDAKISPAILVKHAFDDTLNGKPIEVIHIAVPGEAAEYIYFQFYFNLLLHPHKNGLVLIYSGINEWLENDKPDKHFTTWKWLHYSVVLSKLEFMARMYDNGPHKYAWCLQHMIKLGKQHNYKVAISQLVGNVADYGPNIVKGDTLLEPENKKMLEAGLALLERKEPDSALLRFNMLTKKVPAESPYLLFCKGQCALESNDTVNAQKFLNQLTEISSYNGFAHWKNKLIDSLARVEDIPVAHTWDRFADSAKFGIPGYDLIDDAHHPNLKGYVIMGNEFAQVVARLYNEPVKKILTPANVIADFNMDTAFFAGVYYQIIEWYMYETFETVERDMRLKRLKHVLAQYETLKPDDTILPLWKLIVAILENNEPVFTRNLHKMNLSPERNELRTRFKKAFDNEKYLGQVKETVRLWTVQDPADKQLLEQLLSGS